MKRALLALTAALIAPLALSACAENLGYGPTFNSGLVYYDSYYGPFYNGYWARDGWFYYSLGRSRPFLRDEGRHFRRDPAGGFHGEHTRPGWVSRHGPGGTQPPTGDRRGDHRPDHH